MNDDERYDDERNDDERSAGGTTMLRERGWGRRPEHGDEFDDVDPRMLQRREAVAADRRSQLLGRAGFLLLLLAVVVGAWGITQSSLLDVNDITVRGARQLTPEFIATTSGIELGDALTDIDGTTAANQVAALPWIDSATVTRDPSGVVAIDVIERTAAAVFITETDAILVDRDGRVLELWTPDEGGRIAGLVPIHGVEITAEPGQWLDAETLDIVTTSLALPPEITDAAYRLTMTPQGLDLYLGSMAGRVILGDEREMEAKVWAIRSFADSVDLRCVDALDLRAPSVPVLTFLPNCP